VTRRTRARHSAWPLGWLGMLAISCQPGQASRGAAPARVARGALVARVDREPVTADDVAMIARTEGIHDRTVALDRTVDRVLLAREATRRGLGNDPMIADVARRALIQSLLARTVEQTVSRERLPADELATGMQIRGFELAHGPLSVTQHIVVRVEASAPVDVRARARAVTEALRERAATLPMPRGGEAFEHLAASLPAEFPHRAEVLPAIDASGRHARGAVVAEYARAAAQLAHVGDVSPVVETSFGFHVIVLLERQPALEASEADVRARVRDELLWRLRHRALDAYLDELRRRHAVQIPPAAIHAVESPALGARLQ